MNEPINDARPRPCRSVFSGVYRGQLVAVKFAQDSTVDRLTQKGALETLEQVRVCGWGWGWVSGWVCVYACICVVGA